MENVRKQVSIFLLAFIIIMSGMLFYNMHLGSKVRDLNVKVENIQTEVTRFEKQAQRVDAIKKALTILNQKIDIIKNLETERREAVRLLDNMSQLVAEKAPSSASDALQTKDEGQYKRLWFTNFQATGNNLNIQGVAIDNRTVADFMTRLEDSKLYTDVSLRTLKQTKIKDLYLKSFEIACTKVSKIENKK